VQVLSVECALREGIGALDTTLSLSEVSIVRVYKPYIEVIPAQKLDGEQLQRLNSLSVADAVRYFSGVQLKDYGGVGGVKTLDMRSMGTNHMGVFYDGIQLGNAQNGQIDLGKFSLDNIEEVSLYNGQKSDIFQPAKDFGSAGTIYLRTRRPKFEGNKRTNVKVLFRTGSFGLVNPSVLVERKLAENLSASVNAEYIKANGKYKFRYKKVFSDGTLAWDTTATRLNGDLYSLRLEGGLNGSMKGGKWNVMAYYYDSERGIPGAIVNNVWKTSQRQWDRNFFAQGSFQKRIGSRYELLLNAKYAHDKMRYLNPDTTLMYLDNRFSQDEVYVSTANKVKITKDWEMNLSFDYSYNTLDASLTNFVYPERHSVLTALATAYKYKGWKTQASLLGTFVLDKSTATSGTGSVTERKKKFSEFTPAVFVSYKPLENIPLNFRAYYKNIFRMPTFNDLYYTDIGNANLKPEYVSQYNIGFQYQSALECGILTGLSTRADAYYNEVTDKIIAVPKGTGQYRWMMMNIGKVKIRGVDFNGQARFTLPCDVEADINLSYTFQKAQDYSDPSDNDPEAGTYKGQISYIPWHNGSVVGHLTWRKVELNYSFIYVGERYHNSSNIRANYEQPWYTHDLSAGYSFDVDKVKMKITAEVNNMFNQYYDVIQNYPMPGRNYKVVLRIEI
jgi:outer membrane cobalamin receptor